MSFVNTLKMKCPRCKVGKIFKHPVSIKLSKNLEMHQKCPECGQPTEIEVGFYYGTGYVSYGLTVALTAATFVLWLLTIGISTEDNRVLYWFITNAVLLFALQPWIMRYCRSLWLSWFVKYDPNWKTNKDFDTERIIPSQMEGLQDINKATLEK
jgi:rRNA maturation protein Nop10